MAELAARPIGSRVIVKVLDEERAGIWLPHGARGYALRGIVIEVGPDCHQVERADEVLFLGDRTVEFTLGDESLHVLDEQTVLVVLDRVEAHL